MKDKDRIGLALSGGGYRAASYHIGTLRALRKMDVLNDIDVISTNSGGSITGACYSLHHQDFEKFEKNLVSGVQKSVVVRVLKNPRFFVPALILLGVIGASIFLLFTSYAWLNILIWPLFIMLILFAQFQILPVSKIIEKIYDDLFFHKKTLKNLSKDLHTTINSTNLETGKIFHFSAETMGDAKYGFREDKEPIKFNPKSFPISRAVMASSCVPFAFTPVLIDKKFYRKPEQYNEISPRLVDGGVYDNQGIHKLTFPGSASYCKHIIISDAGNELPFKGSYKNMISLLIRTCDVFMARIKNFQMMNSIYRQPTSADSNVAYQSLGFDLRNSMHEFIGMLKGGFLSAEVIEAHAIPAELIKDKKWKDIEALVSKNIKLDEILQQGCTAEELTIARSVGTNLVPLSKAQTNALIKHAEVITELQVKIYLPHILR